MTAYNPGDIQVTELTIKGTDFKESFVSFDVYESIFAPGIIANITINDANDFIGNAKLAGGEDVNLTFQNPGGKQAEYKFVVNGVKDSSSPPGQKSKSYVIECVSKEAFEARSKYISKKYDNKQYDAMVKNIFEEFLKSQKKLDVEETKGLVKHVIPNQKPYHAIDMIRRRSISPENKSSSYVFFENRDGFFFKTIEQIFKDKNIVKTLVQDAAAGSDFFGAKGNNILSVQIPKQSGMSETIAAGNMNQDYRKFNFQTLTYKSTNVKNPDKGTSKGGSGERVPSSVKDKYGDQPSKISVTPTNNHRDLGQGSNPNIAEQTPAQRAYAESLASSTIKLKAIGDTDLKAGVMITANLLDKQQDTTAPGLDKALSGDFVISALRHMVSPPGTRPRYTCVMEIVKGSYNEDFSS